MYTSVRSFVSAPLIVLLLVGGACADDPSAGSSDERGSQDADSDADTHGSESAEEDADANTDTNTEAESDAETGDTTDASEGGDPADFFGDAMLNIAHRGGAGELPEHTLVAYEGGLTIGVDVLEVDIHETSDSELVIMHDDTVDRTTDGSGTIATKTLAEIKALDAAYNFTTDGSTFPYRGTGITVPTVDEVFSAFPDELYVVEIKPGNPALVAPLLAALDIYDLRERVVLASTHADVLAEIRTSASDIHTSLTTGEVITFISLNETSEQSYEPPGLFLQVPIDLGGIPVLSLAVVERAERLGMKVHPWTINDEDDMRMLIDWGVHGIMTDYPTLLQSIIDEG